MGDNSNMINSENKVPVNVLRRDKSDTIRENLERIIVASAINDENFYISLTSDGVKASDFACQLCSTTFNIMEDIFKKHIAPKESIVRQEMLMFLHKKVKNSEKIDELMYRFEDMLNKKETDMDALNIHLERFNEHKMKDNIVSILNNAKRMADDGQVNEVLDYILDAYVMSFNEKKEVDGINFYDLMKREIDSYNPYAEKEVTTGNPSKTGIYLIDTKYLNGGVVEGNMCIIAGRPGSGKTTLVKVIGLNNARDGKKVLFVSLEMSQKQIMQGYYAQTARVEYGKILKNELSVDEFNRMQMALDREENKLTDYHIVESDSMTISQLINMLIRYKKQYGIEVFMLDYIQQIRLDNGSVPKNEQEYSMISELIRTIIKKLKLQAYICAQVNRDCEKRVDKKPIASDLRSTGKLEQDAAYIFTTYRDEYYNPLDSDHPTDHPKTMDISIAKNRFGPMGVVRVMFEGEYQNIANLRDGDQGEQ